MPVEEEITIITVNYNTSDFLRAQLVAFHRLSQRPFRYLIADNGSNEKNLKQLAKICQDFPNTWVLFRKQSQAGSVGHAEALDLLIKEVKTPYFLVMDADAIILQKNWDQAFIAKFNHTTKALGAPPIKGSPKAQDFPFSYIVFLETKIFRENQLSFMPVPGFEAKGKDTGYLIREKFFELNLKAFCFTDRNTRHDKRGPYGHILCAEYYWPEDENNILACHFARGSSDGISKFKYHWYYKIPWFSSVLKRFLGKRDRKRWIETSLKVVEKNA